MTQLLAQLLAQIDDQRLAHVCGGGDENAIDPVCHAVLRLTDNDLLATTLGALLTPILRILFILFLTYAGHRLVRRGIKVLVRRLKEEGLTRLQTFREKTPLADTAPMDLARATARTETIGGVLRSIATFVIWSIAALTILDVFGVNLGPLIAGAGIVGVAIGFGAQNLVRDFLSGIFMLLEDQYGVGDVIDVGEAAGSVEAVSLRTTRLRDVEGSVWYVPNGEIRRVGNKSQLWSRAVLDIGVAYDTDVATASAVIKRAADEVWQDPEWADRILDEPEVWGVERFGADEITIRLVVKTAPLQQFAAGRELRARIKRAFDAEGIEIPFPQRTVWLRGDAHALGHLTSAKQKGNGEDTPSP